MSASRTRQILDSLVGAHLIEQCGPDRYEFHDLLRAYATDQAQREEPAEERAEAIQRVLTWYLHTAAAAQDWIRPTKEHVVPASPANDVHPLAFPDFDTAVDWAEAEHTNMLRSVRAAEAARLDRLTWQLAAALWNVLPSSASVPDSLAVDRIGLNAAVRLGDRAAEALLLTCLGVDQTRLNRFSESLDHYQHALAIRRDSGDRGGEADSLNLLGLTHLRMRHLDDAALNFEAAITLFQELGSTRRATNSLSNLASTHYRAGHLTDADAAVREVLAAHRPIEDRRGEGNALRLLSDVQCEQGDIEGALHTAHAALDIALDLRNQRLEGFWLSTLGNAQHANGDFADALESFQRSAVLHRRLGDRSREAVAWQGAGETYRSLGRPDEAADFHRQAAATHRELHDPWNEALALDGLAAALIGEDPATARRHWTAALDLIAEYNDTRATQTRERIGRRLTDPT
ncbi:tetratricopeptide repeat protein [Murinocardiopsis flavida]|uniref:Tetratricopeptide repeat protein n=1 Tax=Murinocardiopsis flavida TaxID=645275 RepID=A0A2P8CSW1_9ACTN|nr:tetratricopeptide repeat protein [Murinocardiopsis flavida]PSK88040.1 tetratricopeptide repeat protein [Murinocardiopsis flavida]